MTTICKQCGYPVIDRMNSCPNCGTTVSDNVSGTIVCPHCGVHVDMSEEFCPECGECLYEKGQEFYGGEEEDATEQEETIPVCTLRPITVDGERRANVHTYEDSGEGVSLSRANTMPDDVSIDEELQAHLFFCDGEWFIEEAVDDRRSTFVHAGKGIKLAPGDIIMMGNREFEFNIKTQ